MQLRQYDKALEDFNYVIKEGESPDAGLYLDRGVVRFYLSDTTGSIQDLEYALQLDPTLKQAEENLKLLRQYK